DIDNNDGGGFNDHDMNSFHVVTLRSSIDSTAMTATTVLDGFRIVAGNANGSGVDSAGGGLVCIALGNICNPSLQNLHFEHNAASFYGGALLTYTVFGDASP